jgi:hypothetical protein
MRFAEGTRFNDQTAQFLMHRRRRIGMVQKLIAHFAALQHADAGEQFQLALDGAQRRAGKSGDLADMEFLVGPAQKKPQDRSAGPA